MKHYFFRLWYLLAALLLLAGCAAQKPAASDETAEFPAATTELAGSSSVGDENAKSSESSRQRIPAAQKDERLGTQWGEGIGSRVTSVDLRRLSNTPVEVSQIFYAATQKSGRSVNEAMIANGRVGVSVLNERGGKWVMTQDGKQLYLKGKKGERYQLSYRNYSTDKTYEIVATVDGVDVINGSAGSLSNSGYVLYPGNTLRIEGFRKNQNEVAAFRFSATQDAYAANTPAGSIKNTGVIGTAIFELNNPKKPVIQSRPVEPAPKAFPGDDSSKGYAPPPQY